VDRRTADERSKFPTNGDVDHLEAGIGAGSPGSCWPGRTGSRRTSSRSPAIRPTCGPCCVLRAAPSR